MSTLPTWEPTRISAGDRWLWERQDISDYPAGTWTLSYALSKSDKLITLTAAANGSYHRVDVPAATTATYPAGRYTWAAYVTSGSDRRQIGSGEIEVRPNLAAATSGADSRSFAQQRVEQCEAAMRARDPAVASYSINGRQIFFQELKQVLEELNYWRTEVAKERRQADLDSGRPLGGRLLARV